MKKVNLTIIRHTIDYACLIIIFFMTISIKSMHHDSPLTLEQECNNYNNSLKMRYAKIGSGLPVKNKKQLVIKSMQHLDYAKHLANLLVVLSNGKPEPFNYFMHILKNVYRDDEEDYYKQSLGALFYHPVFTNSSNTKSIALGYDDVNKIGIFYFVNKDHERLQAYLRNYFRKTVRLPYNNEHIKQLCEKFDPHLVFEVCQPDIAIKIIENKEILEQYHNQNAIADTIAVTEKGLMIKIENVNFLLLKDQKTASIIDDNFIKDDISTTRSRNFLVCIKKIIIYFYMIKLLLYEKLTRQPSQNIKK